MLRGRSYFSHPQTTTKTQQPLASTTSAMTGPRRPGRCCAFSLHSGPIVLKSDLVSSCASRPHQAGNRRVNDLGDEFTLMSPRELRSLDDEGSDAMDGSPE